MRPVEGIINQQRAVAVLETALASGHVHHAYVFHGPVGVGKFTTARVFARNLLCPQPQRDLAGRIEACGSCESCRQFDRGSHPDLHVVAKELARYSDDRLVRERKLITIPVDVLQTHLIEPAYRSAQLRHHKVFIVDEAELIDAVGQNKLLKTLEEPPVGTYMVLVTSSPERLLPTIRSRCQLVPFVPLPEQEVARWLDQHAAAKPAAAERAWLLAFADGSIGVAQLAMEYGLWTWAQRVLPAVDQMTAGRFDAALGADIAGFIDAFAEAWVKNHENASKDAANRRAAGLMWSMLAVHLRQKIASQSAKLGVGDLLAAEAALDPYLKAIDAVRDAERNVASNVNLGLVCDHLVSQLMRSLAAPAPAAAPRR